MSRDETTYDERFCVEEAVLDVGEDAHAVGRLLAGRAVARIGGTLEYDGTRPIAVLETPRHETWPVLAGAVSITHTRTQVFAVAARVSKLGIDLVDYDDARLPRIFERYFHPDEQAAVERIVAHAPEDARERFRPRAMSMVFAAKEAGLKALGLGLLDGGVFDRECPVRLESLDPMRYAPIPAQQPLEIVAYHVGMSMLAIAWAP